MAERDAPKRPGLVPQARTEFELLDTFSAAFAAALVTSTVVSAKMGQFGPLSLPAGVLIFPVTFILNDLLTEVYGYARARRVVWTALGCQALAGLTFLVADLLPPAPFYSDQASFHQVIGLAPRVAVAGVLSFFIGELSNSYVMSRMKYAKGGQTGGAQGWRFVASTIVGEGVDTVAFMLLAFLGRVPLASLLWSTVIVYFVKVMYEVVALPVTVPFANWVKRREAVDVIDDPNATDYSPFRRAVRPRPPSAQ